MTVLILFLQVQQPSFDLRLPESQVTSDPKAGRSAAVATQVIQRLNADVKLLGQFLNESAGSKTPPITPPPPDSSAGIAMAGAVLMGSMRARCASPAEHRPSLPEGTRDGSRSEQ